MKGYSFYFRWVIACFLLSLVVSLLSSILDPNISAPLFSKIISNDVLRATLKGGIFLSMWLVIYLNVGSRWGFVYGSVMVQLFVVVKIAAIPIIFDNFFGDGNYPFYSWQFLTFYGVSPLATILIQQRIFKVEYDVESSRETEKKSPSNDSVANPRGKTRFGQLVTSKGKINQLCAGLYTKFCNTYVGLLRIVHPFYWNRKDEDD